MKRGLFLVTMFALSMLVPVASAGLPVINPHPSCSNPSGGSFGSFLGSQAFLFPTERWAETSRFLFNSGAATSTATHSIIISDRERSAGAFGVPAFDSGWIRWVNVTWTRSGDNFASEIIIDWLNETITESSATFSVDSTTWGGTNQIPATTGYRYLSMAIHVDVSFGDFLRDRVCSSYDGYLKVNSALNRTDEILPARFLVVGDEPATPPGPPQNLSATTFGLQVNLSWDWPSDNGTDALTNYHIYRGTSFPLAPLATIGTNRTYEDANVEESTTYFYCVSAESSAGEGSCSDDANATTPGVPGASVLGGSAEYTVVTLSWTEVPDADGYYLYRTSPKGAVNVYELPAFPLTYIQDARLRGTWKYNLTAFNEFGEGPFSNNVTLNLSNQPIFGDDGAVWGPDGKSAIASEAGMDENSIGILYGIVIMTAAAIAAFTVGRLTPIPWMITGIGTVLGIALSTLLGFFPAWLTAFVGVVGVAAYLYFARSGGN